jgi:hypothetical protein
VETFNEGGGSRGWAAGADHTRADGPSWTNTAKHVLGRYLSGYACAR